LHNNQNNHVTGQHAMDERRRQIALLLAQSRTEIQVYAINNKDLATIQREDEETRMKRCQNGGYRP
jgi:hypothetical protein